jgi:hypothetical protein
MWKPPSRIFELSLSSATRFIQVPYDTKYEDDGILEIITPRGRYRFSALVKKSCLDRSAVNAVIGRAIANRNVGNNRRLKATSGRLVLARYVPSTAGEQFIEAGLCFADDSGNVHLRLGTEYNWTILNKREPPKLPDADRVTPAAIQLLFQLATEPESANWTVRDLGVTAGLSKSKVAQLRRQFIRQHVLSRDGNTFAFRMNHETCDQLVAGYGQILRPKLFLGRYRYPDVSVDAFVSRLASEAAVQKVSYALTGGPAADLLHQNYRDIEVPVFIAATDPTTLRGLRLMPARNGPVMLLKAFGKLVYWREVKHQFVAPPWLIYAELLTSRDPRAREVAEELRRGFLQ